MRNLTSNLRSRSPNCKLPQNLPGFFNFALPGEVLILPKMRTFFFRRSDAPGNNNFGGISPVISEK